MSHPYSPDGQNSISSEPPRSGFAAFWQDDTNRLLVIVGGILVVFVLLLGMAMTAAMGLRLVSGGPDRHEMRSKGFDEFGPHHRGGGSLGQREPGAPGAPNTPGAPGGMGGVDSYPGVQHGDVVVTGPNGQPTTKRVARGTISAVTAASVTIRSADGYESAFTIGPATTVTVNGRTQDATSLAGGQTVFAIGTVTDTSATADRITIG